MTRRTRGRERIYPGSVHKWTAGVPRGLEPGKWAREREGRGAVGSEREPLRLGTAHPHKALWQQRLCPAFGPCPNQLTGPCAYQHKGRTDHQIHFLLPSRETSFIGGLFFSGHRENQKRKRKKMFRGPNAQESSSISTRNP